MPRKKRAWAHRTLYAEIPADLYQYLEERAAAGRRTITAEVIDLLAQARAADEAAKAKKGKK